MRYDALKTALAYDPGYDEARLDLIEVLLADNRIDEARNEVELLSPKTTQGIDARFNAHQDASWTPWMPPPTCRPPTR